MSLNVCQNTSLCAHKATVDCGRGKKATEASGKDTIAATYRSVFASSFDNRAPTARSVTTAGSCCRVLMVPTKLLSDPLCPVCDRGW